MLSNAALIKNTIHEAFYLSSTGRKGPVLIDIPKDVLTERIRTSKQQKKIVLEGYNPTIKGHAGQIKKAATLIKKSKRPLIIVGGGVVLSAAENAITDFAQKYKIPVASTLMGKNGFPNSDRLYLGLAGYHGTVATNTAIQEADTIIAVGIRFGDRTTGPLKNFAPTAQIIHIDIDPAEISKNIPSFLPIVGDASKIISSINKVLEDKISKKEAQYHNWLEYLQEKKEKHTKKISPDILSTELILTELKKIIPDPIITTDVGRHQIFTAHHFPVDKKNSFITSGGGLVLWVLAYQQQLEPRWESPTKQLSALVATAPF